MPGALQSEKSQKNKPKTQVSQLLRTCESTPIVEGCCAAHNRYQTSRQASVVNGTLSNTALLQNSAVGSKSQWQNRLHAQVLSRQDNFTSADSESRSKVAPAMWLHKESSAKIIHDRYYQNSSASVARKQGSDAARQRGRYSRQKSKARTGTEEVLAVESTDGFITGSSRAVSSGVVGGPQVIFGNGELAQVE